MRFIPDYVACDEGAVTCGMHLPIGIGKQKHEFAEPV